MVHIRKVKKKKKKNQSPDWRKVGRKKKQTGKSMNNSKTTWRNRTAGGRGAWGNEWGGGMEGAPPNVVFHAQRGGSVHAKVKENCGKWGDKRTESQVDQSPSNLSSRQPGEAEKGGKKESGTRRWGYQRPKSGKEKAGEVAAG